MTCMGTWGPDRPDERPQDRDGETTGVPTSEVFDLPREPVLPRSGEVIGAYILRRRLGRGGMGEVWHAVHREHGMEVAVKLIHAQVYDDGGTGTVPHEFRVLARMRHENIVRVIDAGTQARDDGSQMHYIVMEYLPGATPITTDANERGLDVHARLGQFLQVCSALAYVHGDGDLHLDVKPDNILVDTTGRVFLIDFGIARPVLGWSGTRIAGTLPFMSPEHLRRDRDRIDKRADVWSLGALLFRLLTGEDAFGLPDDASVEARARAVAGPPRTLRETRAVLIAQAPELLGGLESVVRSCLAPHPDHRFDDAGKVATAIRRILAGGGLVRRAMGLRRHRPRVFSGLVLMLVVLVAAGVAQVVTTPVLARWSTARMWIGGILPAPPQSLVQVESLPDVVIVEFDAETAASLVGRPDLETFQPGAGRQSYRPMHAAAIRRLVDAGARVVVLDVFFSSASVHDDLLAAAIREARSRGVSVVLGVNSWVWADGRPTMSGTVWEAGPLWGAATVGYDSGHPWVHLLVQRPDMEPMPAISTAAFAAFHAPGAFVEYASDGDRIRIRAFRSDSARPDHRQFVGATAWLVPSGSSVFVPDARRTFGLQSGDTESYLVLTMPSERAIQASTIRYEQVWDLPADALARRFSGRIAFIADRERDETEPVSGVRGALLHAVAIQSLVAGHRWRMARWLNLPLTLAGALIGALVAAGCIRGRSRRPDGPAIPAGDIDGRRATTSSARRRLLALVVPLALVLAAAVLLSITWAVRFTTGTWLHPMPGAVAAALAALCIVMLAGRPAGLVLSHGTLATDGRSTFRSGGVRT